MGDAAGAVPEWSEQLRRLTDGIRGLLADPARAAEGLGHGSECRWCPLCQAIAVVRGERPEISGALADLLTTAATALRALAAEPPAEPPAGPAATGAGEAEDGAGDPEGAGEPPEVQRIEIA
jgi:hypothetical protein